MPPTTPKPPATPTLCRDDDPNLEPVEYRIDAAYIATHEIADIVDPVWWVGNIYDGVAEYDQCLEPFTREQRLMYALLWYRAEVDNGGHEQFFDNGTGIVYPDALAAFEALGLPEGVAILTAAGKRMGGVPSRDRAKRMALLARRKPDFDDLDDRFDALGEKVNLDAVMTAYARAHADAFTFEGTVWRPKPRRLPGATSDPPN